MITDTNIAKEKIIMFIQEIGITIKRSPIVEPTFLPGIKIEKGTLIIDEEKLLYPGDILHEAGHLAVMAPEIRNEMDGNLDPGSDLHTGGELMAIPWTYAAALHLSIDPKIVFHKDGYKGGGESIIDNFRNGRYFGVSMLQWIGLTYEPQINSTSENAFPKMIKWVRE